MEDGDSYDFSDEVFDDFRDEAFDDFSDDSDDEIDSDDVDSDDEIERDIIMQGSNDDGLELSQQQDFVGFEPQA